MSKTSTTLDKNVSNMVQVTSNQNLTKLHNQPLNVEIDNNRSLLTQINKSSKLNSASHLPFKKRYLQDFSGKANSYGKDLTNQNDLKDKIEKGNFMVSINENVENLSNHKNLEENILPKNKKLKQGEQIKLYQAQVSPCSDSANGTSVGDRSDNSIQSSPTMKRVLGDNNESNRSDHNLNRTSQQETCVKNSVGSKGSKPMLIQDKFTNAKVILQLSENNKNSKMSAIPGIDVKNGNLRIIKNLPLSATAPKNHHRATPKPKKQYIHLTDFSKANGQFIPKESYIHQPNTIHLSKSNKHLTNIPILSSNTISSISRPNNRSHQYIISKNKSCNNLIVTPSSSNIILSNNNGAKMLNNGRQFVIQNQPIQNLAFTNGNRLPVLLSKNAFKVDVSTVENLLSSNLTTNVTNNNKFVNNSNQNFNILNSKNLLYSNEIGNFNICKSNNVEKIHFDKSRTQIDRPGHVQSPEQNKQKAANLAMDLHQQILKARKENQRIENQQRIKQQIERPIYNNLNLSSNNLIVDEQNKLIIKQQKQQAYLNQQQKQQLKFYEKRNLNENISLSNVELNIPLCKNVSSVVNTAKIIPKIAPKVVPKVEQKLPEKETTKLKAPVTIKPEIVPVENEKLKVEKEKLKVEKEKLKVEKDKIEPKKCTKPEQIEPPPICVQLPDLLMKQKSQEIEKEEAIKEINLKILKDKVATKTKEPDTPQPQPTTIPDPPACLKTSLQDSENDDKNTKSKLDQNFESDSQNDNSDNHIFYKSICERTRNKGLPSENKNVIQNKKKKYYENSSGLPDDESDGSPKKKVKKGRKLICGGEFIKNGGDKINLDGNGDEEYRPSVSQQKNIENEYGDIGSCGEKEVKCISPKTRNRSNSSNNLEKRQRHRNKIKRHKSPDNRLEKTKKRRRHPSSVEANRITGIQETLDVDYGTAYNIDSNDESWNSITCFCRKPFAGRIMVECESCKVWYHIDCFKIKPNEIPKNFNCGVKKKCKLLKNGEKLQKQKRKVGRKLSVTKKKEELKKNVEITDSSDD